MALLYYGPAIADERGHLGWQETSGYSHAPPLAAEVAVAVRAPNRMLDLGHLEPVRIARTQTGNGVRTPAPLIRTPRSVLTRVVALWQRHTRFAAKTLGSLAPVLSNMFICPVGQERQRGEA